MFKTKIFKTITYGVDKVEIIDVTARQYSAALAEYCDYESQRKKDKELGREVDELLDIYPWIVVHFCLFNGKRQTLEFVLKLKLNIYTDLLQEINNILNPIE